METTIFSLARGILLHHTELLRNMPSNALIEPLLLQTVIIARNYLHFW